MEDFELVHALTKSWWFDNTDRMELIRLIVVDLVESSEYSKNEINALLEPLKTISSPPS